MNRILRIVTVAALVAGQAMSLAQSANAQSYWYRWKGTSTYVAQPGTDGPEVEVPEEVQPGVDPEIVIDEPVQATVGQNFAVNFRATNINALASNGSFPPGLYIDVNSNPRKISGLPIRAGDYTFNLKGYARTLEETRSAVSNTVTVQVRNPLEISASPSVGMLMVGDRIGPVKLNTTQPGHTTFSLGGAPAFMTLNGDIIDGVASQVGDYTRSLVTAKTDRNETAQIYIPLRVVALPQVVYSSRNLDLGRYYTITPTGLTPQTTLTVSDGALPPGLTLEADGRITGNPSQVGTYSFSITASRNGQTSVSGPFRFEVVYAALAVTPPVIAYAYVGRPISVTSHPSSEGGTGPFEWTATGLPVGISIDPASGTITGTPTGEAGTKAVTLSVKDSVGRSGRTDFNFNILSPYLALSTQPPSTGMIGRSAFSTDDTIPVYAVMKSAVTPVSWSFRNAPAWVGVSRFDDQMSRLAGSPTETGNFSFTLVATDANGVEVTRHFSLNVIPSLQIVPPDFGQSAIGGPLVVISQPRTETEATGLTWSLRNAPAWLTINPSTGALGGTVSGNGSFSFVIEVVDANGYRASRSMSVNVLDPDSAGMALTGPEVSDAYVGETIRILSQPMIMKGVQPLVWSFDAADDGLRIDTVNGILSAVPATRAGAYSHTLSVKDANGAEASIPMSSRIYALPVVSAPEIAATKVGKPLAVSRQPTVSGGKAPITWTATNLPAGIVLSDTNGVLSGSPEAEGHYSFKITATDANGRSSTVNAIYDAEISPLVLTEPSFATGTMDTYLTVLRQPGATGGVSPYTWRLNGAPSWLEIDPDTGVIGGVPTALGTYSFNVTVRDKVAKTASTDATISVSSPVTISVIPSFNGDQTVGQPLVMATQAQAVGGDGNYTWTLASAPAGMVINTASGAISGSVATPGIWTPVVNVRDGTGVSASVTVFLSTVAATSGDGTDPGTGTGTGDGETGTDPNGSGNGSENGTNGFYVKAPVVSEAIAGYPIVTSTAASAYNANGSVGWVLANAPSWLTLSVDGYLFGTPPASGIVEGMIVGTDGAGNRAADRFVLAISEQGLTAPVIATVQTIGSPLAVTSQAVATGMSGTPTWSISGAPSWVVVNPTTGALSGTVGAASATFTLRVTDGQGRTLSTGVSVTASPPLAISRAPVVSEGEVNKAIVVTTQAAASGGKAPYTWSLANAPSWINFNTATGAMAGTPTIGTANIVNLTMRVTDADGRVASTPVTFQIHDILALTPPSIYATQYSPIEAKTVQLRSSGGKQPYVFSISGAPTWLSMDSTTGALTGTPMTRTSNTLTITVTDALGHDISVEVPLNVDAPDFPPLTVSAPIIVSQTVNTPLTVSRQPSASGGYGTRTWSLVNGPAWLHVDPATGALSGTVGSEEGPFTARLVVNDTLGVPAEVAISGDATTAMAISLPAMNLLEGTQVSIQPTITGGKAPFTWSYAFINGYTLAKYGLSLDTSTGVISGTVVYSANAGALTLTAYDSAGRGANAWQTVTTIRKLSMAAPVLAGQTVNSALKVTSHPVISGGMAPYTFTMTDAPTWLKIDASTGQLSGTVGAEGTWSPKITVTDALGQTATATFSVVSSLALKITMPNPVIPAYSDTSIPGKSEVPIPSGGTGTGYKWSLSNYPGYTVPAWMTIDGNTGVVTISPPAGLRWGIYAYLNLTDSANTKVSIQLELGSRNFALTTPIVPEAQTSGAAFAVTRQATVADGFDPWRWSLRNAPSWMTVTNVVNAATGTIGGTVGTETGTYTPTLVVTDKFGNTRESTFTIVVSAPPKATAPASQILYVGEQGSLAPFTVTGGRGPFTWAAVSLPAGMTINATTGVVSGTPTTASSNATYNVRVTDTDGRSTTASLTGQQIVAR